MKLKVKEPEKKNEGVGLKVDVITEVEVYSGSLSCV